MRGHVSEVEAIRRGGDFAILKPPEPTHPPMTSIVRHPNEEQARFLQG